MLILIIHCKFCQGKNYNFQIIYYFSICEFLKMNPISLIYKTKGKNISLNSPENNSTKQSLGIFNNLNSNISIKNSGNLESFRRLSNYSPNQSCNYKSFIAKSEFTKFDKTINQSIVFFIISFRKIF